MEAAAPNLATDGHSTLALRRRYRRRRALVRASKRIRNPSEQIHAEGGSSCPTVSSPLENAGTRETEGAADPSAPAPLTPWLAPDSRVSIAAGATEEHGGRGGGGNGASLWPEWVLCSVRLARGAMVSQACRDRLHVAVEDEVGRRSSTGEVEGVEMWKLAMVAGFARVDADVMEETKELQLGMVGSTAVASVVTKKWIIVADCGDSRAVLSHGGVAMPLFFDHKPNRPEEHRRVEAQGGQVLYWDCPRVVGVLSTSRSFATRLRSKALCQLGI